MEKLLTDQVVIVTGASSGLGRATAAAFAKAGADVALLARSEPDLRRVASEVEATGRRALVLPTDLSEAAEIHRAVDQVVTTFKRVDVLINNGGTDVPGSVKDLAVEAWDLVLDVNLRAPFILSKAVFPHMQRAGHGTILNVSSVAGRRGWANAAAYCASKFGLTGFTQALAAEGKEHGVRAMVIYPGAMSTHWGNWTPEERHETTREASSEREALPPEEVAALLVWIASSPNTVVLNEVTITPLEEKGWP